MSFYESTAEKKGLSYLQHRKTPDTKPHFHGAIELVIVNRGKLSATVNGEKYLLYPGDGIFVDCFSVHAYTDIEDNDTFVLLGKKEIFDRTFSLLSAIPKKTFKFSDFALLNKLTEIYEKNKGDEGKKLAAFEGAAQLILSSIEQTESITERKSAESSLVISILKYAEENFTQDLSLSALSKKFGYTNEHISRTLHSCLAENWNEYVGRLRVKKAHDMILNSPDEPVLKAAFDCGFSSANTFYRAYKKEYGNPPKYQ